jgi:glycolate oxidase iron-sulfur subunit
MLMKAALECQLSFDEAAHYIDRCLGCLACVTACPAGVQYGELMTPFRAHTRQVSPVNINKKIQRALINSTLPHPKRFRAAAMIGKAGHAFRGALPAEMQPMLDLLPDHLPPAKPLPSRFPAQGKRRARVILLSGCVQQVLAPEINWATLRVLARNGVETLIPRDQGCCGAILIHTGEHEKARQMALHNMQIFSNDVDAILTNAAGCGSGMKEYPMLFTGRTEEEQAVQFAKRVKDISEFLIELGLLDTTQKSLPGALRAAYHDACHLSNAQAITAQPRELLKNISNLTLVEIPEGAMCCGSAGSYNIEQPEIAAILGCLKAQHILESGAEAVVTGNIGCMVQVRLQLQALGKMLPVFHTIELLDMAGR